MSLDTALAIAGLLVGLLGFGFTLIQVWGLRDRANAIEDALQDQRGAIAGALLLPKTVQLEEAERRLLAAVKATDPVPVEDAVIYWRRTAAEARAYLDVASDPSADLIASLEVSLGIVDFLLKDLKRPEVNVQEACGVLITKISLCCRYARISANTMALEVAP